MIDLEPANNQKFNPSLQILKSNSSLLNDKLKQFAFDKFEAKK